MPPFRSVISFLAVMAFAALTAGLALPGASLAQPGWVTVRSSDFQVAPDVPPFSLKYPPWFERDGQDPATPGVTETTFNVAHGNDTRHDRLFLLTFMIIPLKTTDHLGLYKNAARHFEVLLRVLLNGMDYRSFSGVRVWKKDRRLVADTDYAVARESNIGESLVFVQRMYYRGPAVIAVSCVSGVPLRQGNFKGFAYRKKPGFREICLPFIDSLEFDF
jgi:hypothetical protein